jgi:choline dehydrogenase-like flavoprotein
MPNDFDVVVIGSGFGGAICSARLAEAGYRVVILDRGRQWDLIFIEDGGLPNIADGELRRLAGRDGADDNQRALIATVRLLFSNGVLANVMPWFAPRRGRRRPVAEKRPAVPRVGCQGLEARHRRVVAMHQQMALRTGGLPLDCIVDRG